MPIAILHRTDGGDTRTRGAASGDFRGEQPGWCKNQVIVGGGVGVEHQTEFSRCHRGSAHWQAAGAIRGDRAQGECGLRKFGPAL